MGPGVAQRSSRLEARRLFGETCDALRDAETNPDVQLAVIRRRAGVLGWVLLLLVVAAIAAAVYSPGIAARIEGAAGLLSRSPWNRIARVSVVTIAMVIMAILGTVNHLPRPDKKRPAPKQSCGCNHSPSS
jgi:hypothetical protein